MPFEIVDEKGPLLWAPPILFAEAVEIDRERGDEIEFSTEVGQRLERPDSPDAALDAEETEKLGEERELVDVQTEAGMP
jgi:hypothetical protein